MALWHVVRGKLFPGLRISVDGQPVQGSVDDPQTWLLATRYVWFYYALSTVFMGIVSNDATDPSDRVIRNTVTVILGSMLALLGFLTKRIPLITTFLGSLWGVAEVITEITDALRNGSAPSSGIVQVAAAAIMIRGFVASLRLTALKRRQRLAAS